LLPACQFVKIGNIDDMSAAQATAEVFVTAFKSLKRNQREAVLEKMLADEELSEDFADTLALEARRHQPRQPFRQALKALNIRATLARNSPGFRRNFKPASPGRFLRWKKILFHMAAKD
jgi:hypothetical protein